VRIELLEMLRCPESGLRLRPEVVEERDGEIYSGWLISDDARYRYPVRNFIPRFVPESNYTDSFGFQWNKFRRTQLDSYSGHPISANRFWKATGWHPEELQDTLVLDVGCGAGRFAEVALSAGATVIAVDYSSAVEAFYENLRHFPRCHVLQADIYRLPLQRECFQFVYSLGVLQHTPDVGRACAALPLLLAPGGQLSVDVYERSWKAWLHAKYWVRPLTRRMDKQRLFSFLEQRVPQLLRFSCALGRVPGAPRWLRRMIPVANYHGILPLSQHQHMEWALLDTFDWLSPEFDNPQTAKMLRHWLTEAGLDDIEILKAGHLVGRGMKKR
jgi:SAM-dependent methyltransferase